MRRLPQGDAMTDSRRPTTLEDAIREADEVSEHLLIHHANADVGTLITDEGANTGHPVVRHVMRHAFNSPCVQPHECWNRLEIAIRSVARAAIKEAVTIFKRHAEERHHTGSMTIALAAEECASLLHADEVKPR